MHKGLGFQLEFGEQRRFGGYCNWCWRIGHKEAQCWFKQEYMKSNPSQNPLQRDIHEWSNTSEKGQGHSHPKGKGKGKGKRKHPGNGNTMRTRLDLRMKMDSARWVILCIKVRESPIGSSSLCVLRSKVQDCHDGLDGIAKLVDESFFQVRRGVRSQRAIMKRNLISPQE